MIDSPYDSSAPYNQRDPEPVDFDKTVMVTMSKEMSLSTCYYEDHVDCDGNGYFTEIPGETDWEREFQDEHKTIPELLEIVGKYAKRNIARIDKVMKKCGSDTSRLQRKRRYWSSILEDSQKWKVEELVVE